uniref:Uncharacterized protein n=1 Tax=Mycena chlorophos TaxID=658473 RepID=A0ABQ0L2H5_MYCCL|nr:predicted protein [Mycena chlorophos]
MSAPLLVVLECPEFVSTPDETVQTGPSTVTGQVLVRPQMHVVLYSTITYPPPGLLEYLHLFAATHSGVTPSPQTSGLVAWEHILATFRRWERVPSAMRVSATQSHSPHPSLRDDLSFFGGAHVDARDSAQIYTHMHPDHLANNYGSLHRW